MDKQVDPLLTTILALRTLPEARRFFRDLLTDDELAMFARRWQVVSMLNEGASYRRIELETGMSSRTVARIARWLKQGPGGYRLALERRRKSGSRPRRAALAAAPATPGKLPGARAL
jgi:TrpR-related protein YerC/YecD